MVVDTILENEETTYKSNESNELDDNKDINKSYICKITSISLMLYGSVLLSYKLYKKYYN